MRRSSENIIRYGVAAVLGLVLGAASSPAWTAAVPLGQVPVPEPPAAVLSRFIKDRDAAVRLGKALFWEMQAGSDGVTACASCHYRAGADPVFASPPKTSAARNRNQLHPGPDTLFGNSTVANAQGFPAFTSGYLLQQADFPLYQVFPVDTKTSTPPSRETNDIVGSQGVRKALFDGLSGSPLENFLFTADPVFQLDGGTNLRQVSGRNAPSVVNAVFNFTNFWDGRASNSFNGVNAYGPLDQEAGIWINAGSADTPQLVKRPIAIPNASLASQAVAPPVDDTSMSFTGRTFPLLGRKLLALTPLGLQRVHPLDAVLGAPLSRSTTSPFVITTGLNTTYGNMIRAAFVDDLWNATASVHLPEGDFSQMEANFSLFWGLAIQMYEATLVSDRTRYDLFLAGNRNALTPTEQEGLGAFTTECAGCHSGSELTSASMGTFTSNEHSPVFTNNTTHTLIRSGQTNTPGISDSGFFNTGVRPTADDRGRGGDSPIPNPLDGGKPFPLSFSRLAEMRSLGLVPFPTPKLPPNISPTSAVVTGGSFKTPGLRNVELTPPYFHNGSAGTLTEVVEFYSRGGNFDVATNPEKSVLIAPIGGLRDRPAKREEIVAFLLALTDDRVRNETAPFDHPELLLPDGSTPDAFTVIEPSGGPSPVVAPTLTVSPAVSPTSATFQAVSGTTDPAAAVTVSVNGAAPVPATVAGTPVATWTFTATGLRPGTNRIAVSATNLTGGTTLLTTDIIVLPRATISGIPASTTNSTVATVSVSGQGVTSYRFQLDGGTYSPVIPVSVPISLSGLTDGVHTIAVIGREAGGTEQLPAQATTATWQVKTATPLLTINPVTTPTARAEQRLTGTVEAEIIPRVSSATGFLSFGTVTISGSSWNCLVSGLTEGTNVITVTATDVAGNVAVRTAAINLIVPDGNIKGFGAPALADAVKALRIAIGLEQPTPEAKLRGDVAPLFNGVPAPDGIIDVADVVIILRKILGLSSF